jgi:hypothetical protein
MLLRWTRRFPESRDNFDLRLLNPEDLDATRLLSLLAAIEAETHRGLTLNHSAARELERFFLKPTTPLKEHAYTRLSNWYTTGSGDRSSSVASGCEALWDEMFACRPLERLTSPQKNHLILPSEFASFWSRLLVAQGDSLTQPIKIPGALDLTPVHASPKAAFAEEKIGDPMQEQQQSEDQIQVEEPRVKATYQDDDGRHIVVEGNPKAMAVFLQHLRKPARE